MDDVLMFDLQRLDEIMAHRGITLGDIADDLGCSVRWLRLVFKRQLASEANLEAWVNKVDDAVTRVSDAKGGVPMVCCGLSAYGAMINVIEREGLYG